MMTTMIQTMVKNGSLADLVDGRIQIRRIDLPSLSLNAAGVGSSGLTFAFLR
jgi:hypothetical protein